jgi:hypothetical protein
MPADLREALEDCTPTQLRNAAKYAEELATHREREARLDEAEASEEATPKPDSRPAAVPTKASITTKTINDNRYYYWQWREGDEVKSKYHGPVEDAN